jgi:hypothetical protein
VFFRNGRGLCLYWEYIKKGGSNKIETDTTMNITKRGVEAQEKKFSNKFTLKIALKCFNSYFSNEIG